VNSAESDVISRPPIVAAASARKRYAVASWNKDDWRPLHFAAWYPLHAVVVATTAKTATSIT
jgi:hypothetical protein